MFRLIAASTFFLYLLIQPFYPTVSAHPITNEDCTYRLNTKIQQDVISSFPALDILKDYKNLWRFKHDDLINIRILIGKEDTHLNSLISMFYGTSMGDKELIIINGEYTQKSGDSFTGYLLYKEIDGTNVLAQLKKGSKNWEVVKVEKVKGKYITRAQIDKSCVKGN
ncbi:hypothetical protein LIT25_18415 [Bacillus sp. F19]|nr:hypothetical protein LIT25_18415 [Bacillus sp. F19]